MKNICDGNLVLLSSIGYSGFNALFGKVNIYFYSIYKIFLSFYVNQDGRVVKALDLSSNGGIPA